MSNKLGIPSSNNFVPVTPGSSMPAGTIISYSGSIASFTSTAMADSTTLIHKDGWAVCNGASVPKATYSQLFARVDTIWNASANPLTGSNQSAPADATNNFRVPNLQGTFLRGVGDFTDNTMDTTLAGFQAQKTSKNGLAVTNSAVNTGGAGSHLHYLSTGGAAYVAVAGGTYGGTGGFSLSSADGVATTTEPAHTHSVTSNVSLGAGDSETRPQNVGVYYLIKLYDNAAAVDVYIPSASAGVSGLVDTGAQTFAGVKTFNDGIKLDDAAGQSTLNHYAVTTGSTAITGVSGSHSFTWNISRVGNTVTLHIKAKTVMTVNAIQVLASALIPVGYRPSADCMFTKFGQIAGTFKSTPLYLTTGGDVYIYADDAQSNWSGQTVAFGQASAVSWIID